MSKEYETLRVMNNNVILARNLRNEIEVVLMGNGIGFGKKKGQIFKVNVQDIEKEFVAGEKGLRHSYLELLEAINGEVVALCTEILAEAEKKLGALSDRSFIVIVDHISFAIEKLEKGIKIENPFTFEIQHLYPEEYAIGAYARKRIEEVVGVDITEDEIGFIALHLSAAKQNVVVSDALKNTRIIKTMIDLVEGSLDCDLRDYPRLYNRLLLHLRGFIQRVDESDFGTEHPLFKMLGTECKDALKLANKLKNYVAEQKHVDIPAHEVFYLTLHMDRLIRKREEMTREHNM